MLARFCLCVKKFELVLFVFSILIDFRGESDSEDVGLDAENTTPPSPINVGEQLSIK